MSLAKRRFFKVVALVLTLSIFIIGSIPRESMAYVVTGDPTVRVSDMETVQRVLEQKLVSEKLESMGLTMEEVQVKLAQLDDTELHQLASQIESLYPGGDALGFLIVLLILIILVVLVIKLADNSIEIEG